MKSKTEIQIGNFVLEGWSATIVIGVVLLGILGTFFALSIAFGWALHA